MAKMHEYCLFCKSETLTVIEEWKMKCPRCGRIYTNPWRSVVELVVD